MSGHTDTISDFCNISSSKRIFAREYQSEGIPFWRGKEIVEKFHGKLEVSTELFIPVGRYEEIKAQSGVPKVGDILLTSVGTIGVPYLVRDTKPFYFKDGNITWLQTNETVCAAYLYYWLISPIGKRELSKCTIGVAQPAYTIVRLKRMSVSFPDLPTQERIASILSAYDDLIENNRRRIALLEQAARLLYREWFVHFRFPGYDTAKFVDGLPEAFSNMKLGTFCRLRGGNAFKVKFQGRKRGELPFIKVGDMNSQGNIVSITEANHWVDNGDIQELKAKPFEEGDVVFAKIGEALKQNRVRILSRSTIIDNNMMGAIPNKDIMSSAYLYCLLSSYDLASHASGAAIPFFSAKVLSELTFIVPEKAIMDSFDKEIEPIIQQIQSLSQQASKIAQARDLLLPRLMDGRIPVKV